MHQCEMFLLGDGLLAKVTYSLPLAINRTEMFLRAHMLLISRGN
jgi:hypothetical protein